MAHQAQKTYTESNSIDGCTTTVCKQMVTVKLRNEKTKKEAYTIHLHTVNLQTNIRRYGTPLETWEIQMHDLA